MNILSLDDDAGKYFSFKDFIECGDTWKKNSCGNQPIDNRPVQENSWLAIAQLAKVVLDPVWHEYGKLFLTYGFCSQNFARLISKKSNPAIASQVDQHASCELNTKGNPICRHLGAACDYKITGKETQMDKAALWIASNLRFDSMYYGRDRSLHISWGPAMRQMVVLMKTDESLQRRSPTRHGHHAQGIALVKSVPY